MRRRQGKNQFETRKFTGGKELTAYSARNGYVDYLEIAGDAWQDSRSNLITELKPGLITNSSGAISTEGTNATTYRSVWMELEAGTYTINSGIGMQIVVTVIDNNFQQTMLREDGSGYTFSIGQTGNFGMSMCNGSGPSVEWDENAKIFLNKGDAAKGESPSPEWPEEIIGLTPTVHAKNTVTYPYTLYGMGDVKDRLIVDKTQRRAWIERNFKTVTLDGAEGWSLYSNTSEGVSFYRKFENTKKAFGESRCSHMKNVEKAWASRYKGNYGIYSEHNASDAKYFRPPNASVETVEQWKTWLGENNMKVVYQLATPAVEEIPWSDALLLITQLGDNIISLVDVDDHLYPTLEVHTKVLPYCYQSKIATGNPAIFDTTVNKPLQIGATGWTEQDSTTGAQMIPFEIGETITSPNNYVIATCMADGIEIRQDKNAVATGASDIYFAGNQDSTSEKGYEKNILSPGSYTTDLETGEYILYVVAWRGGKSVILASEPKSQFEVLEGDLFRIFLRPVSGGKEKKMKVHPIVCRGSTALPWEPYTGGQPSPSPDYPQAIVSEGTWNSDTQKYERTIKVTGKNLWKAENAGYVSGTYRGWLVNPYGKNITISLKDKGNDADISGVYFGSTVTGISANGGVAWAIDAGRIQTKKNRTTMKYVSAFPNNNTTLEKILNRFDVQVEYGDTETEYEPYRDQTVKATSDRPVTKWDRLECRDGVYGWVYGGAAYIVKNDVKIVTGTNGTYIIQNPDKVPEQSNAQSFFKCTHLIEEILAISTMKDGSFRTSNNYIYIKNDDLTDIETAKKWLMKNNVEFIYKAQEPEFVPLPEEEQAALKALFSYSPTTVVSNDTDMFLQVEYQTREKNGENTNVIVVKDLIVPGTINISTGQDADGEPYRTYRCKTKGYIELDKGIYTINAVGALRANVIFYNENEKYTGKFDSVHHNLPFEFNMAKKGKIRIIFSNNDVTTEKIDPNGIKNIIIRKVGEL